jgi:predicted nucleic acid-binding protein
VTERVFVDTSVWYALADSADAAHKTATDIARGRLGEKARLVTTNQVVSETYTLLRNRLGGQVARDFLFRVRTGRQVERVFVAEAWEVAAEDLLERYGDQTFSYVDATSFVVMRRLGIQNAFTLDQHFATAGFNLLSA